jgi:hypothetical protein
LASRRSRRPLVPNRLIEARRRRGTAMY